MNAAREQAERTADRVRAELSATLQELDRRRRALDLRYRVEKHFLLVVVIGAGASLVAASALLLGMMRARARRKHLVGERIRDFMRAWNNPQHIGNSDAGASPRVRAREVAIALAVMLATRLVKGGAQRLLPPS